MAVTKTNAVRILDSAGIIYKTYTYECKNGPVDGVTVANQIGMQTKYVYKTLVTRGASKEFYVFVVPVESELNLKSAAKAVGEKSIEMIRVDEINKITGYVRGGCSPVGMKKAYKTVFDESCSELEYMIVSAGKIGLQMQVDPKQLTELVGAKLAQVTD